MLHKAFHEKADDGHNKLAMLVRREGETLAELLTRRDLAIAKAQTEGFSPTSLILPDELNSRLPITASFA